MEVCRRVGLACRIFQLWEDNPSLTRCPHLSQGTWENATREKLQVLGSMSEVLQLTREGIKLASLPPCLAPDCDPGVCGPLPGTPTALLS